MPNASGFFPHGLASSADLPHDPVRRLLDSHRRWTGRELVARGGSPEEEIQRLFEAPLAVVSHDDADDPVFWFGNRRALELFELSWPAFTALPSRLSAEPVERAERERLLARVSGRGYIDDYRGIRVSATGRRFYIENALVWNLLDEAGRPSGQAAAFDRWTPIPS